MIFAATFKVYWCKVEELGRVEIGSSPKVMFESLDVRPRYAQSMTGTSASLLHSSQAIEQRHEAGRREPTSDNESGTSSEAERARRRWLERISHRKRSRAHANGRTR